MNINTTLVSTLVSTQFPNFANLPIQPFNSAGTDNAIFRLGNDMLVRLPLDSKSSGRVNKEYLWLPKLAPKLPLTIPTPIVKGMPTDDFPYNWSICQWIEGDTAILERINDPCKMAQKLAEFINVLQKITPPKELLSGQHNEFRGVSLSLLDKTVRNSITTLHGEIDTNLAMCVWESSIKVPVWQGDPVWLHGDLQSGNLIAKNGNLHAVIDFGLMGVGDPACDIMVAWTLLPTESRKTVLH